MHISYMLEDLNKTDSVDVLFLGSSHAYRGFDVRVFQGQHISCFNLGTSSQTPIQTNRLLTQYLDKFKPKLVIYEVFPELFTRDGVESTFDFILNGRIGFLQAQMVIDVANIKALNTCIVLSLNQLFSITVPTYVADNKDDHYISNGYMEKDLSYYSPHSKKHTPKSWVFLSKQKRAFEKSLQLLNQKGIKYILVQTPYTNGLKNSIQNYDEIDAYFAEKGMYYNFNELMNLDDSLYFFDDNHLNKNGVALFNKEVLKTIEFPNKPDVP